YLAEPLLSHWRQAGNRNAVILFCLENFLPCHTLEGDCPFIENGTHGGVKETPAKRAVKIQNGKTPDWTFRVVVFRTLWGYVGLFG
ncbi:MAG TPA: hypothetical protein VM492_06360, partial [Sumerlaeia bacterium]|nr:hypothetical protein [Sumerlaeia bacterium]